MRITVHSHTQQTVLSQFYLPGGSTIVVAEVCDVPALLVYDEMSFKIDDSWMNECEKQHDTSRQSGPAL